VFRRRFAVDRHDAVAVLIPPAPALPAAVGDLQCVAVASSHNPLRSVIELAEMRIRPVHAPVGVVGDREAAQNAAADVAADVGLANVRRRQKVGGDAVAQVAELQRSSAGYRAARRAPQPVTLSTFAP
jgi:hypothetical protein